MIAELLSIVFLWLGFVSVLVILSVYARQKWWRNRIGRFLVLTKLAFAVLYAPAIVLTVTHPGAFLLSRDLALGQLATVARVVVGLLMAYGAYAFVVTTREARHFPPPKEDSS